jgi:hypothetical protein
MTLPDTCANEFHFFLDESTNTSGLTYGGLVLRDETVAKVFNAQSKPARSGDFVSSDSEQANSSGFHNQ